MNWQGKIDGAGLVNKTLAIIKTNYRATITALYFFSVLPIPQRPQHDNHDPAKLNEAVIGFPLAGLLIAIPCALVWYIAGQFLSSYLAASLTIAFGAFITGALHEDGLSDCFDALAVFRSHERALEIMRDSNIGTYGASALFFSFLLRILALASLNLSDGIIALLLAHSVARGSMIIAIYSSQYARQSGAGDAVCDGTDKSSFCASLGLMAALSLIFSFANSNLLIMLAPIAGLAIAWLLLQWLVSRLDGYTGDGLGAMEQVAEITILLVMSALLS